MTMDELSEALEEMKTAMGAAVEFTAFLFNQLIAKGFTRDEALKVAQAYLMGMIGGKNGQT